MAEYKLLITYDVHAHKLEIQGHEDTIITEGMLRAALRAVLMAAATGQQSPRLELAHLKLPHNGGN